jgi:hypothetical protein
MMKCELCDEEFVAIRTDQRFCGPKCRNKSFRQNHPLHFHATDKTDITVSYIFHCLYTSI